jgi:hypothetical protein
MKTVEDQRLSSIVINLVDLNLVPINLHALLREIPLINVFNYAFTFDDIIESNNMIILNTPANNGDTPGKKKALDMLKNVFKLELPMSTALRFDKQFALSKLTVNTKK